MKAKTVLIDAIDRMIGSEEHAFSAAELAQLKSIRKHLVRARTLESIAKWTMELTKFMTVVHEFFKK